MMSIAPSTSTATIAARNDLAPGGKLRAAISFGNPILAHRDAASDDARGAMVAPPAH